MAPYNDPISSLPNPPAPDTAFRPRPSSARSKSSSTTSSSAGQAFHDAAPDSISASIFPPAEEASLLAESATLKSHGNTLFSQQRYSEAISTYDQALASCPNYLEYETAVLRSNVSACHLQLEEWKEAVERATEALEGLDRLDPPSDANDQKADDQEKTRSKSSTDGQQAQQNEQIVEIPADEDDSTALQRLSQSDSRRSDIERIRTKSLLRRARARHKQQTWACLAGAEEDYNLLLSNAKIKTKTTKISPTDLTTVRSALAILPAQITAAKDREMGEMMGKLKELGNGILKPFGLSTDNFNMVQDQTTGGYSMNFEGGKK